MTTRNGHEIAAPPVPVGRLPLLGAYEVVCERTERHTGGRVPVAVRLLPGLVWASECQACAANCSADLQPEFLAISERAAGACVDSYRAMGWNPPLRPREEATWPTEADRFA